MTIPFIRRMAAFAVNPYVEVATGLIVIISGMWQLAYELPGEIAGREIEGHHAVVIFGFFISINSFLRFFKGLEHAGKGVLRLSYGKTERALLSVRRFMEKWWVEFTVGSVLVIGGFAELFEESLEIDRFSEAPDNDYLWFAVLLVIGTSMLIKSLMGTIDVLKFMNGQQQGAGRRPPLLARLDALLRRPSVEGSLAAAIIALGIWQELVDSTPVSISGIEAHHGIIVFGMERFFKMSQDLADGLELTEDALEEDARETTKKND